MKQIDLEIEGMSCNHCVKAVELELKKLKLNSYEINIGNLKAKFEEDLCSVDQIKYAVSEAGYTVK